ncbi:hypothetical protein TWF694_006290 [Orbilia ellipsospora]|uniref:Uncharacterized protein n=1 Tax=Orbilia ellipsospora TaxID=2528407 RepID=A0AAV9XLB9_9PEZI
MSKNDRSTRGREYRDRSRDRYDRYDRHERSDRDRDTTRRSRRHRSPSYDSYSDSESSGYSSDSSSEPSRRRPSRRHTTAYSDGEEKGHKSRGREHRRREREYYSEESPSRERKGKAGIVEDLLAAVGLIQSKDHDRRDRSDGHVPEERKKQTREALQAALTAAAMEAFRTRKEGKLTPQRLMQIAGAAIAAGGLDVIVDRSGGNGGSLKTVIESVVAGLATGKTMGKNIKHKREDDSVGNKVGTGVVGMAAKHLARSLSQGPRRSRTTKY